VLSLPNDHRSERRSVQLVAAWAERLAPEQEHEARLLAAINAALELRNQGRVLPEEDRQAMSPLLASAGYRVVKTKRRTLA
jgi:hypothetical protein